MSFLSLSSSAPSDDATVYIAIWISVIVICLVVEACTSTLTTIWFAGGAVFAAILAACNVNEEWQFIIFIVSSALMLFLTRPLVKKLLKKNTTTNKDNLIGVPSYVTEKIDNLAETGYVKINGVYWVARSVDNAIIEEGSLVEVKEIQGNKLIVSTVNGEN